MDVKVAKNKRLIEEKGSDQVEEKNQVHSGYASEQSLPQTANPWIVP